MPLDLMARLRAARNEPWKAALPPSMLDLLGAAPDPMAVLKRVIGGGVPVLDTSEDAEPVEPVQRKRKVSVPSNVGPDTMLRLEAAAELAFPDGSMSVAALRREAAAGRLTIYRIAGKDFTTLSDVQEMKTKCRVQVREHVSGLNQKNVTQAAGSSAAQHGSSATERVKSARAALEATAKALNAPLLTTSRASTKRRERAVVIPLKF
jgi:hypothetical protein